MSTRSVSSCRRTLAAGAALLGCSFVAADANAANLVHTTLQSASGSMTIGSQTAVFSMTGPANSWSAYQYNPGVSVFDGFAGNQYAVDIVSVGFITNSNYTSGSGSGSFTVTFNTRVRFSDDSGAQFGVWPGTTWDVGGVGISSNDEFAAGTYTFNFSFSAVGAASNNLYSVRAQFVQAPAGGVPLPGAAGLAACGLLGISRRRRR